MGSPVKFDDLSKTAKDVLDNDYQTSGYQFKAKQNASWNSTVATTTVDLFGKDAIQTPAKLSFKVPNIFGIGGLTVDKLELDKAGKAKLEASAKKESHGVHGLVLEAKSDLKSVNALNCGFTFTGLADTQIKADAPLSKPDGFSLEATRSVPFGILGLKCGMANLSAPDVGFRFASGPLFGSLLATKKLSCFTVHAFYKASDDIKVAASCTQDKSGKGTGASAGVEYKVSKDTTAKAKVQHDRTVSASVKHNVQRGFTLNAGGKYSADGKLSYGLSLSIE
jgi:hypothetical protein